MHTVCHVDCEYSIQLAFPSLIMSQKFTCKPEFFFFLHPFSPLQRVPVPAHYLFRACKCPWTALMLLKYRMYPCSAWLKGSDFNLRFIPSSMFSTWCTKGAKTHGQIVMLAVTRVLLKIFFKRSWALKNHWRCEGI